MKLIKDMIKRYSGKNKIKCIDIRNGESFKFLEYLENKQKENVENYSAHRFY